MYDADQENLLRSPEHLIEFVRVKNTQQALRESSIAVGLSSPGWIGRESCSFAGREELEDEVPQRITMKKDNKPAGACGWIRCANNTWWEVSVDGTVVHKTDHVTCGGVLPCSSAELNAIEAEALAERNQRRQAIYDAFLTDEYYETIESLEEHIEAPLAP